ncbi:MAG: peptidylprolyl isomerase [Bdellovibrionales bacterium]|nr:peptidylprolyl isomerase [Bdellovibrionales bacterium]
MNHRLLVAFVLSSLFLLSPLSLSATPVKRHLVDAIIASVNGKPITLREVTQRMPKHEAMSLSEASRNPEVRYILDALILEKLIEEEALSQKLSVTDNEILSYISEVANRNGLALEDFYKALDKEGISKDKYQHQVKFDILRSKLASTMMRKGVGISEEEVDRYIEEHPEISHSGTKLKLRQIFISTENRSDEDAKELIEAIRSELEDDDFPQLSRKYSESSERSDGGLLGVIAEEDLSGEIFDAVFSLEEDQTSEIVHTNAGFHLFHLDERYREDSEEQQEQLRAEIRKTLEQEKLQSKMQTYFSSELYKLHAVEKKL